MRKSRSSKISVTVAVALLVSILIITGILRGQNKYPDPVALAAATPYKNTFFDPDPNHPWNQLYGLLFIRPAWNGKLYGLDEMDPLYWNSSRYLLDGPLHQKTLNALDQFIQSDAAHMIKDPLKRALLQRMLWALFDRWSAHFNDNVDGHEVTFDSERRELQIRLAKIMRSVALADDEIATLPDNYKREVGAKLYPTDFDPKQIEQPFLPGTFFSGSDWVDLDGTNYDVLAPVHVEAVSGRSAFHILISLPTGRKDTIAYLNLLKDFQPHWVYDQSQRTPFADRGVTSPPWTNGNLPQIPLLTKFALVRTANLINVKGALCNSPLMESVQIRVIRTILPNNSSGGEQAFFLFELDPKKLINGEGGLVAKSKGDLSFDMVLGDGANDPLQKREDRFRDPHDSDFHGEFARVTSCFGCHDAPGIFSMNSYIQFFQSNRTLKPPELREGDDAAWTSEVWKRNQYNWGLLQAYWFAQ